MEQKKTFPERTAQMKRVAQEVRDFCSDISDKMCPLLECADIILSEAQHMEVAAKKFAQKKAQK